MTATKSYTAEVTSINTERLIDDNNWDLGTKSWDTITITEWPSGEVVDTIQVESSDEQQPYERAVWDAGYHDAEWL